MPTAASSSSSSANLAANLAAPAKYHRLLVTVAVVSCCLGLAWVAAFPFVTISTGELKCRGLFISENAFPRGFRRTSITTRHSNLAPKLQANYTATFPSSSASQRERDWFRAALTSLGATVQDVDDRLGVLVATVPAVGRGSHKEAIVLAAPFPSAHAGAGATTDDDDIGNASTHPDGAFVLLSLVSLLAHDAPWLSKDVLFVFGDEYGPWLQAYVGSKYPTAGTHLTPAHLLHRSGALRLAAVLDWPAGAAAHPSAYGVVTQAPYGRLPDMDLVAYLIRTVDSTLRAPLVLSPTAQRVPNSAIDSWSTTITNMFRFMFELAFGPYARHAPFLKRAIDSVTLKPVAVSHDQGGRPLSSAGLLRLLEAFVEAGSALEERLHASFYFYVLLSPTLFVSIGEYVYPGVLACILPAIAVIGASAPTSAALFVAGGAVTLASVVTCAGVAGVAFLVVGLPATPVTVIAVVAFAEAAVCAQLATVWSSVPRGAVLSAAVLAAGLVHAPLGMLNFSFVLLVAVPALVPATLVAALTPSRSALGAFVSAAVVSLSAPCVVGAAAVAVFGTDTVAASLTTLLAYHHWSVHPQVLYGLGVYLPVHSVLLGLVLRGAAQPPTHHRRKQD